MLSLSLFQRSALEKIVVENDKNWHAQGWLAALWHRQVGTEEPWRRGNRDSVVDPITAWLGNLFNIQIFLRLYFWACKRVANSSCSLPILLRSDENNKDLQRKPWKVLWKVPRYNHHRNVFYCFPLRNSSPPSSASWTKRVICDAGLPKHLLYISTMRKLSRPLVLYKMLWFERRCWNVKHYCCSSEKISVHLLTRSFLSVCLEIHTKQFRPH